jgi:hypothetical protein
MTSGWTTSCSARSRSAASRRCAQRPAQRGAVPSLPAPPTRLWARAGRARAASHEPVQIAFPLAIASPGAASLITRPPAPVMKLGAQPFSWNRGPCGRAVSLFRIGPRYNRCVSRRVAPSHWMTTSAASLVPRQQERGVRERPVPLAASQRMPARMRTAPMQARRERRPTAPLKGALLQPAQTQQPKRVLLHHPHPVADRSGPMERPATISRRYPPPGGMPARLAWTPGGSWCKSTPPRRTHSWPT